jgi:hypothetical protein
MTSYRQLLSWRQPRGGHCGRYVGKVNDELSRTAGGHGYWYPGASCGTSACLCASFPGRWALPSQRLNTFELNAGVTWKWVSCEPAVSTGDDFVASPSTGCSKRTRGAMDHDLTATWPLANDLDRVAPRGHRGVRANHRVLVPRPPLPRTLRKP